MRNQDEAMHIQGELCLLCTPIVDLRDALLGGTRAPADDLPGLERFVDRLLAGIERVGDRRGDGRAG